MNRNLLITFLLVPLSPLLFSQDKKSDPEQTIIDQGKNEGLTIEGRVAFTEGPAWHAASKNVYFSDIENNRIMRRDPTGKIHIYRTPSGRANGLIFDTNGRLYACEGGREGGNRRVTRTELDGSITVLTADYSGKKYNSPNDLVIDSKGRIFFTDPRYGDRDDMQILDSVGVPVEGVYRIDPDGKVTMILSHEIDRPNGIALSADEKHLFVADNSNAKAGDNRKLWRFDLKRGWIGRSQQPQGIVRLGNRSRAGRIVPRPRWESLCHRRFQFPVASCPNRQKISLGNLCD